ncbi:MAG: aspartate aminotransferase family protein [Deltaproteobacteria bacterium HGW-Deltaproteobacteria-14]|jgi:predicted acetylornithine/succinylornithine family transaminase|nr:MAG: aspartate aminotransferase family protein [Deltaproteobacteria bacterium HGW-Deltaproteobacteria-14]
MTNLFRDTPTVDLAARAASHYTSNYRQIPIFLTRGEGVWVWDRDGRRYLDMVAGIAVNSLGHAHPRLVAAIREQADALMHVSNLYFNEPALALMDKLVELTFADRVFFANSGAEANEAALKLARRYRTTVKKQPNRTDVLAFENSFHGRTFGTVAVTGQPKYQKGFEPLPPGVHFARFGDLGHVEEVLARAEGRIGTVILEPVQCEGGLNFPPAGFLKQLRKLCDAQDMVLIYDEVQTGVGRTGEWFYYEVDAVKPDIMTSAKGIAGGVPLGAMLCTDEVGRGFEPGSHASTFGGNPLATRAGLEVLRTIEEEKLLDHVFEVGSELATGLKTLCDRHPERCVEARGMGLLQGLELRGGADVASAVVAGCQQRGLLMNAIQGRVLRFVPPLIVQSGHIQEALSILDAVLGEV